MKSSDTLKWLTEGGPIPKRSLDKRRVGRLIRRGIISHTPDSSLLSINVTTFKNCVFTSTGVKND